VGHSEQGKGANRRSVGRGRADVLVEPVNTKRHPDGQHVPVLVPSLTLDRLVDVRLCLVDVREKQVRGSVRGQYGRGTAVGQLVELFVVVVCLVERSGALVWLVGIGLRRACGDDEWLSA
jgi:hypothetical protein